MQEHVEVIVNTHLYLWHYIFSMTYSVHLAKFPDVSALSDEARLVADMDRVRDICTAALAVREKENIRVRQPLARLAVYGTGVDSLAPYTDIIADELNVKEVVLAVALEEIASRNLKVLFPVVGKRLGTKMKEVAAAAKSGHWEISSEVVLLAGEKLMPGEYEITLTPKEGVTGAQALASNDALVVLDLVLTPELKAEGIARDVVRAVQQARKDADLNITDRINLKLEVPENIREAVSKNERYIKEQVLAASMVFLPAHGCAYVAELEIEGTKLVLGLDKI